jgi:hypothetical protein
MNVFNRRGAKTRSRQARASCRIDSLKLEEGDQRVEVSVPSFDEDSGHGHNQCGTHSRRVLVSATGECTPVNDDGDSIPGDDVDESVGVREVTRQRQTRKLSLPHMSFGKLTGSFEDKIIDAFIWLRKQTQGKQIHATKVQQKNLLKICHKLLAEL